MMKRVSADKVRMSRKNASTHDSRRRAPLVEWPQTGHAPLLLGAGEAWKHLGQT
jgi:hypothetical protein